MNTYITIETTPDKILAITIDCPDTKVNKVSSGLLDEIMTVLDKQVQGADIKGLAILSAKPDNFVVGADLEELKRMQTKADAVRFIEKCHQILNRLEALPIPVVAGIHGNCLGGGLELALAADYRIASNSTSTVLGLPEVQVGLIPAAGGTQRLPRLIGLAEALPMMLMAKNVRPKKARKLGLIDEICDPYTLREATIQKALQLSRRMSQPKPQKRSLNPKALVNKALEDTRAGRMLIFQQARKGVLSKTFGLYPAPLAIINSVETGYKRGVEEALRQDIDTFGELVMSPQSKSLMSLFFGMTELKKNPLEDQARPVEKLGIIGAGLMGAGIATVSAPLCESILLKDVSLAGAAKGMREIAKSLDIQARSGGLTPFEKDTCYGKLVPCDDDARFGDVNLVIEAVFEDLDLKRKVLADVEAGSGENTIFASNTSALPIGAISEGCRRPQNVIGMHYFSPVHRMPLLEIITTDQTAEWVLAAALEFGIRQGKTCIVVKDGPGFYTTRILAPLLNEAVLLIEEGARAEDIDQAMLIFGYPVGPVALLDEVGIDVGAHVSKGLGPMFRERGAETSDGLPKLFAKGFLGKKNKKGFYRYDQAKRNGLRRANPDVYKILGGQERRKIEPEEIQDRISLMMVNEAVLCLQEGIITSPRDGDVGAILGLGFPPFRGGPFRHVDTASPSGIVARMENLQQKHGHRFAPAELLVTMAGKRKRFHE